MGTLIATPNYKARTFTIRKNGSKYRTGSFSKQHFEEMLENTESDWNDYLRRNEVVVIK